MMKSLLALLGLTVVAACVPSATVTAKLVDSRAGLSMTGVSTTICTYGYSDAYGDHRIEKTRRKDAVCPATIKVET